MKKKSPKKKIVISILAVLIVVVASISFGVGDLYVSGTWRYKMTVEIETPEGLKTGSAIRELSNYVSPTPLDFHMGNPADIKGEALVVDLGERGLLFVLISDTSDSEFYRTFPIEGPSTAQGIKYYKNLELGLKRSLDEGKYFPQFVTFKDITNPKTVQAVDHNDLSETFGSGVQFKAITLEITDEPVTNGIEVFLPWLLDLNGHYLHGGSTSRNAPLGLHEGNFKK